MLDELDLQLIRLLQEDARAQYAKLARATGASEATVKRRVEALIGREIITPITWPNMRALGYHIFAIVGIKIDGYHLDEVAQAISDLPESTLVVTAMGRFDLIAFVVVRDLDSLTALVNDTISAIPGVRETETLVTPKTYKSLLDWRIPVKTTDELVGNSGQPSYAKG